MNHIERHILPQSLSRAGSQLPVPLSLSLRRGYWNTGGGAGPETFRGLILQRPTSSLEVDHKSENFSEKYCIIGESVDSFSFAVTAPMLNLGVQFF